MRGYGRDYDDGGRYPSGGSTDWRDRARHNPSWEGQAYGSRGYDAGFRGGQGGNWRGGGYGRDYNDYGRGDYTYGDFSRQYPTAGGGYDRGMRGGERPRGRLMSRGHGLDMAGYGGGAGFGGYAEGHSFTNPTHRGDFFTGYGAGIRRGYSPFW